jgi:hypothetical protein
MKRPGKFIEGSIVLMWFLAVFAFLAAAATYVQELVRQVGPFDAPNNPISPFTASFGLASFIVIAYLARRSGWKTALLSATAGVIAAPMIFELPFDLIVFGKTFPPTPALQFSLLFFLPLFLVEILSFLLLTFSPIAKLSRYTMFSLAAMFFVFAVWALFGFAYPSSLLPIALNVVSKMFSFIAVITIFLPQKGIPQVKNSANILIGGA